MFQILGVDCILNYVRAETKLHQYDIPVETPNLDAACIAEGIVMKTLYFPELVLQRLILVDYSSV